MAIIFRNSQSVLLTRFDAVLKENRSDLHPPYSLDLAPQRLFPFFFKPDKIAGRKERDLPQMWPT